MISEPELVGGPEFDRAELLVETPPPRPPRARRPWLWALGGAVLASAVWGAGLYAYERREEPGPDLGGYRPSEDLCRVARLTALAGVLGERTEEGKGPEVDEPEMAESSCSVTFGPSDNGQSVEVTYTLHKVIDPGAEFEVRARQFGLLQEIDDLGEKAFFDAMGEDGGQLRVLDGQAEIALTIYRQYNTDEQGNPVGDPPVDLSGIEVPMAADALALMAELKK